MRGFCREQRPNAWLSPLLCGGALACSTRAPVVPQAKTRCVLFFESCRSHRSLISQLRCRLSDPRTETRDRWPPPRPSSRTSSCRTAATRTPRSTIRRRRRSRNPTLASRNARRSRCAGDRARARPHTPAHAHACVSPTPPTSPRARALVACRTARTGPRLSPEISARRPLSFRRRDAAARRRRRIDSLGLIAGLLAAAPLGWGSHAPVTCGSVVGGRGAGRGRSRRCAG